MIVTDETNLIPFSPGPHTISQPKYVGGYRVGGVIGLQVNFITKPNWFHRKMMKLCLGWEWIDNKL